MGDVILRKPCQVYMTVRLVIHFVRKYIHNVTVHLYILSWMLKKNHHMIDFYETRANTIAIRIVWVHCMQYKREDPNDFLPYRLKTSHFTKNNKVYSEFIYSAFVILRSGHAHLLTPSEWMVRIYTHLQNRLANVSYGLKCRLKFKTEVAHPTHRQNIKAEMLALKHKNSGKL